MPGALERKVRNKRSKSSLYFPASGITLAGEGCPIGTYKFAWNGEYFTDNTMGCFSSGSATKNGTLSGGTIGTGYGQVGSGLQTTANNQYLTWVNALEDGLDNNTGTLWMSVKFDGAASAGITIFESTQATGNYMRFNIGTSENLIGTFMGNYTTKTASGTATLDTAWHRVGFTWDTTVSGGDCLGVQIDSGGWECLSDTLVPMTGATTDITIGENGQGGTYTETVWYDNVYILATFKAVDPYSP